MKNLTWQNPEQLFVAQELINKVKSKCCGIKAYYFLLSSSAYFTDTPVCEFLASGKASGANLTLRGFDSPLRVVTLDNVLISDCRQGIKSAE